MPSSVVHRFIPGLRFEDSLTYQTCTQSGQTGRDCVSLEPENPEHYAGQGVWWCARRCAAVLQRQPWRTVRLPPHRPAGLPLGLAEGKGKDRRQTQAGVGSATCGEVRG